MNRRQSILRRSVRAGVGLAMVVLVVVVGAGTAAAVAAPGLTVVASPSTIVAGGSAVISGALTGDAGGVSGASVELVQRPAGTAGEWTTAAAPATTGADGTFSFRVMPAASTDYQARYLGSGEVPAAQADVRVTVLPRLAFSAASGLWPGETLVMRGSVAPAHPAGTTVVVDRKVDGVWQPFLTTTLDASSRFAVRWTPTEPGYYRFRVRMDADAEHGLGVSGSRTVIVNRPNAHDVPMRYAHYIVIVRHEYRLFYYEHGVLVRGFDVALGRPGYRTPLGLFRVYGKRKPAGGALGACAMFYRRQGGIAIHGTNQPYLVRRPAPRAFSHGCARMLNRQVLWLYARVPVGTRVHNLP